MQIKVEGTPASAFNLAALETAFQATSLGGLGVFESGQHPIIVGQGAYNSAYGSGFQNNGPDAGLVQIFDTSFTFKTLFGGATGPSLVDMPLQPKMIQDEMGEAYEQAYGRMSGFLGLEMPNAQAGAQNMILYPFVNPPSELIDATNLPQALTAVTPISVTNDGTQIWKITHNGVDTHPIHFHLYDVQLINRVGWDGIIRKPDANELGWKDTIRISPLEDTIVALRPIVPQVPFDLPNSVRPLNPMMPLGSKMMFNNVDAWGIPTADIINSYTNFGWEYMWHCHILSHEEMDMMRAVAVAQPPIAPTNLITTTLTVTDSVQLDWTDNSLNETSFVVQRATAVDGPWTDVATLDPDVTTYTDLSIPPGDYFYQVIASNLVGYVEVDGYSTLEVTSTSNIVQFTVPA